MKRILSALRAVLKAATSSLNTVWTYCRDSGKWIGKTVASIGGGGAPEAGGYDLAMAAENDNQADALVAKTNEVLASIETPKASGGDGYDRMQRVCRDLCAGDEPAADDIGQLSPLQLEWVNTMTPEMRFIVGNETRQSVISHIRGGKGLHGVIRADAESINGWKDALAIEMAQARQELIVGFAPDQEDVPVLRRVG